jgi:stage IV sporulation protein B
MALIFRLFLWIVPALLGILTVRKQKEGQFMKKFTMRICIILLCVCVCGVPAWGAEYLIPVGQVIGLELRDNTVTVAAIDEQLGTNAKAAGLCAGDKILAIDGRKISCAEDVRLALQSSQGTVALKLQRKNKLHTVIFQPQITADGPKLGIFLKEKVTGIGTVTWYDPETKSFGTLGHGVSGPDGKLVQMTGGNAYCANVVSVTRGKAGKPGQLRGSLSSKEPVGQLTANTDQGLFGTCREGFSGTPLPVAQPADVKTGPATIYSTIAGTSVREYSVEILKVYPHTRTGDRNLVIRVTDPALLAATGGIVQGMSGSPIIQDGKLVGAVTHVLVNDPTTGYGIFIENMLDAAA